MSRTTAASPWSGAPRISAAASPRPPATCPLIPVSRLFITRTCRHAQTMAAYLSQAGLEVLNDVVLNQVLVRSATDDQTLALVAAVQQDGTCWCGPTVWQHRPAMRISVSGWATTAEDIRQSADAIIAAAQLAAR